MTVRRALAAASGRVGTALRHVWDLRWRLAFKGAVYLLLEHHSGGRILRLVPARDGSK